MRRKNSKKFAKINFKRGSQRAKEMFLEKLNLPDELVYDSAKITMIENSEIYIEGRNSIVDYLDNYIKVQTEHVYIIVDGSNLRIEEINETEVLITGKIDNVGYIKR